MRVGDHAYEPLVRASITPARDRRAVGHARHRAGRARRRGPGGAAPRARVLRRPRRRRAVLVRRVGRGAPRGDLRRDRGAGGDAGRAERRPAPRRAARRAARVDARAHVDGRGRELRPDAAAPAPRGRARRAGPVRPRGQPVRRRTAGRASSRARSSTGSTARSSSWSASAAASGSTVEPFAYREGSNTSVLTARQRDAYRRPSSHHDGHELATEARDAGVGAVVA